MSHLHDLIAHLFLSLKTSLYGYTTVCLRIQLLKDILITFSFLQL